MPKTKKSNKSQSKSAAVRALFITSIALNIGFLAFLLIVWGLWDNGSIDDNQVQTSLCHNFYKKLQSSVGMQELKETGKTTQVGNVTFINTNVDPSVINSPCWQESQAANFVLLSQINNPTATNYYLDQTNSHAPNISGQYKIPLFINSKTNQPTIFPY